MSLILGEHHTANPDVCAALHNVTGWDGTHLHWNIGVRRKMIVTHHSKGTPRYGRNGDPEDYCELSETKDSADRWTGSPGVIEVRSVPAYDLGYLMRRVPASTTLAQAPAGRWTAADPSVAGFGPIVAHTPEDAMALLCNALNQVVVA